MGFSLSPRHAMTRRETLSLPADWSDLLDAKIDTARDRLVSIAELSADLSEVVEHPNSPLGSVQIQITRPRPHNSISIGASTDGEGDLGADPISWLVDDFDDWAACRVELRYKSAHAAAAWLKDSRTIGLFGRWARAFWKSEARDLTGFLWWHNRNLRWNLENTIRAWMNAYPFVSTVQLGMQRWDDRSRPAAGEGFFVRWGVLLEEALPRQAMLVRKHTDEFLIFLPSWTEAEPQVLTERVIRMLSDSDHMTLGSRAPISTGFATMAGGEQEISARVLVERAELGVQHLDNVLRLDQPPAPRKEPPVGSAPLDERSTGWASRTANPSRPTSHSAPAKVPLTEPHGGRVARERVFISYSHADAEWLERLQKHLKPLQREGIDVWDDTRLKAGAQWREEIRNALAATKVAILLVSADFLGSEFILTDELPPLLKAAEEDGATILPVIVSPSRFARMESLSRFQAVNDPEKPLVKMRRAGREEVLDKVARAVEDALKL